MAVNFLEKSFTSRDGLKLYYREYQGSNQPILCLSGLSRNSKDFHRLALHLQKQGHLVICPDYRGRGKSDYDPNPMNYHPPTYLDDIFQLLTALNIHQVVVIGTSLGGLLAMAMGAAMPSYLKAVILNDVGPDVDKNGLKRIISYLSLNTKYDSWDKAMDAAKAMFKMVNFANPDDWQELAEASFKEYPDGKIGCNWDINIIEPLKQNKPTPDLWPLFYSLKNIPLLTIRGEKSDILNEITLEKMISTNPKMQYITVPKVGHVPSLNEKISRKAIDDHLKSY